MNEVVFSLILGTATPGGGFPVYGDAYAAMLNAQEPKVRIETRNTKGSTENVPLLEAGKLDLGLVAGELASAALASVGSWSFVLARPGLPDEQGYLLAGALHRSESAFAARLEQARESTAANTVAAAPRRDLVHPGALKYFREAGLAP
ncbi:MAG: hypothetical protein IT513_17605 [Burkholderiales bacterium]|nr:hypothetical protein [Burkholderiales bacterium]